MVFCVGSTALMDPSAPWPGNPPLGFQVHDTVGAIRATAQNARAAKILGVDTEKVYAATFGINAALCGVAGALISITFTIHPYMGLPYTIRSFMIVIVAGLGNLPGVALSAIGTIKKLEPYEITVITNNNINN